MNKQYILIAILILLSCFVQIYYHNEIIIYFLLGIITK